MKLTTNQLKQIIQEELEGVLKESPSEYKSGPEDYMDASVEDIRDMVSDFEAEFDMDFEKRLAWVEYKTWKATLWSYSFVHTREGYFKHIKPIEMAWIHAARRVGHAKKVANSYSDDAWLMQRSFSPPILHPENIDFLRWVGTTLLRYYSQAAAWNRERFHYSKRGGRGNPQYPFVEARTAILKYVKLHFPEGDAFGRKWNQRRKVIVGYNKWADDRTGKKYYPDKYDYSKDYGWSEYDIYWNWKLSQPSAYKRSPYGKDNERAFQKKQKGKKQ